MRTVGPSQVITPSHPLEGGFVDQVENVRFVLTHLGKPSHTKKSIVRELAARQYSTVMLRGHHSPGATITPEHGASVLDAIVDNLRVYEFGLLDRKVGGGYGTFTISGCIPSDGPWAKPEDFARIRAYLKESDASTGRAVNLTFSGLRVTFNGAPAVMLSGKRSATLRQRGDAPLYHFSRIDTYPTDARAVPDNRQVSAPVFAESIVRGIMDADGVSLKAFDPDRFGEPRDSKLEQLRAQRTNLQTRVTSLTKRKAALAARLFELDEAGNPVLRGALFRRAQEEYNHIEEDEEAEVTGELRRLESEITEREAHLPQASPADQLLHLVASLRDSTDRSYRGHWLASLKEVAFTSGAKTDGDLAVKTVSWTGLLILEANGNDVSIPFGGAYEYSVGLRNRAGAVDLVNEALLQMRGGVAIDDIALPLRTLAKPHVASALGISTSHMFFNGCRDPRVRKIVQALLESPDSSDDQIASAFAESRALISRIRSIHCAEGAERPWIKSPGPTLVAFYAIAAANDGIVTAEQVHRLVPSTSLGQIYNVAVDLRRSSPRWSTQRKKGYVLAPCECGSIRATMMTIPEPSGAVCLNCRRDECGLVWPAEPYDEYIAKV